MSLVLAVDPGETTGWAMGSKPGEVLDAGQTPLWEFIDEVAAGFAVSTGSGPIGPYAWVERLVVEDWAIYPWEAKALAWDKCRTARGIGALELIGRLAEVPVVLQPAKIKDRAEAAGAESLFETPLHENRHQNDAIRHLTYWFALGERGLG